MFISRRSKDKPSQKITTIFPKFYLLGNNLKTRLLIGIIMMVEKSVGNEIRYGNH